MPGKVAAAGVPVGISLGVVALIASVVIGVIVTKKRAGTNSNRCV